MVWLIKVSIISTRHLSRFESFKYKIVQNIVLMQYFIKKKNEEALDVFFFFFFFDHGDSEL